MTDLTGQRIERYQILEKLGEGGMATVYKARDTRLERDVALKLIRCDAFPPAMLDNILARFEREAKSLARLSHPNIVTVHDYGEYDGAPYLVLEYCPGGDLRQHLHGKPINWPEAIQLVLPVARALRAAHQAGVIHRDVKPSNIMFTGEVEPKLSDFGIAKILEANEAATLTGTGVGVGTPGYMAPEQWTGETSPKSDQYGLGVVLYELLTGRKPYEADTPAGVLIKQTSQPLPAPSQLVPTIPPAVEVALLKALDRDPAGRYDDMGVFIKVFEELLAPETNVNAPTDYFKTVYAASALGSSEALGTNAAAPISKRPAWKLILIGFAALGVLGGVFWAGMTLSKGSIAITEPSATPTQTESVTLISVPSKTPIETSTPSITPPSTDTPTATVTSTPACADIDVSGFWKGNQVEVVQNYYRVYHQPPYLYGCNFPENCDKIYNYPISLLLTQSGCAVSGEFGIGLKNSFKSSCEIQGTITDSTIHFPLQPCLFTGTAVQMDFYIGKLVDELNGSLPLMVCKNASLNGAPISVSCYIHLERDR